jgi:hypothetical protein
VRCSWCEPLLDGYLESTLAPRQRRGVTEHLRRCESCREFLRELRVVDALLATARSRADVGTEFTAAVLSATRRAPLPARRRIPPWLPLGVYLAAAWALAAFARLEIQRPNGLIAVAGAGVHNAVAALLAGVHALAPLTPMAAALVTIVLAVDLLLLAALAVGYHRVRPLLAFHLARIERP